MKQDSSPFLNPLCVALDVDSADRALELAQELAGIAGGFKLGPRLCLRYGRDLVQELVKIAPVFVDNKHFDIPSTMRAAVKASFEAGASVATIHALSGKDALREMARLEQELNQERPFRILAVTILTSWGADQFSQIFKPSELSHQVEALAREVKDSGLQSLVCSAHELALIKPLGLYALTPGIRFADEGRQDQQRVLGPKEAVAAGANALVVGRPIIEASCPRSVAGAYLQACL